MQRRAAQNVINLAPAYSRDQKELLALVAEATLNSDLRRSADTLDELRTMTPAGVTRHDLPFTTPAPSKAVSVHVNMLARPHDATASS
jgi:hypothetical protein